MWVYFDIMLITTNIIDFQLALRRAVTKSIVISSQMALGIYIGCSNPISF